MDIEATQESINTLLPFLELHNLLDTNIERESKEDFLTFVRLMAPTLVSDWKMGKHIEVISDRLNKL